VVAYHRSGDDRRAGGGNTISGTVTFTGAATGPLYVGVFDMGTGTIHSSVVPNPVSPQAYSVSGIPNGSNYFLFGIIDQNNNGLIDAGDINNTNQDSQTAGVAITNDVALDLVLPSSNSSARLTTDHQRIAGQSSSTYNLNFRVNQSIKLPVAVALISGPNVLAPVDIAVQPGKGGSFEFWPFLNTTAPNVGDPYQLQVRYSDGVLETLDQAVTGVLDAFVTGVTISGPTTQPTISWTDPASASSYVYQFDLWDSNWNQIWRVPRDGSFSSAITSIVWGVDPTDGSNTPSVGSLSVGTTYQWSIRVSDANGNSATKQGSYTP
jgi:hypothetical protein